MPSYLQGQGSIRMSRIRSTDHTAHGRLRTIDSTKFYVPASSGDSFALLDVGRLVVVRHGLSESLVTQNGTRVSGVGLYFTLYEYSHTPVPPVHVAELTTMIRPSRVIKPETAVQPDGSWKKLGSDEEDGTERLNQYTARRGEFNKGSRTCSQILVSLKVERFKRFLIFSVLCRAAIDVKSEHAVEFGSRSDVAYCTSQELLVCCE